MKIWRRNAVVATVLLFVCVALYLNWSYNKGNEQDLIVSEPETGKALGEVMPVYDEDPDSIIDEAEIYVDNADNQDIQTASDDYFANARLSRQKARDSALALLKDTAESEKMSKEARDSANDDIRNLAQNALKEAQIESLVQAKGYKECVAFINTDGLSIVVTSPSGGLTKSDSAKITEIATKESGLAATKITITEISKQ